MYLRREDEPAFMQKLMELVCEKNGIDPSIVCIAREYSKDPLDAEIVLDDILDAELVG